MDASEEAEVIVIGTGPAIPTAAHYLAPYGRDVPVFRDGKSRALRFPKSSTTFAVRYRGGNPRKGRDLWEREAAVSLGQTDRPRTYGI
ncbi:hypothetical protein SmB9_17980 [Sphingosinicella microcystinivorans]|uniref:Uncharacterized protein n=1 Tax=Sphingosinicella microcystinivorans TaxID=335406 RepID=A0AAD1D5T9_SPHMI|nr:hypothetical protein SmB9_17980 [Sphingosinicella microcystinivorans]